MFYRFRLKPGTDIEEAWMLLEAAGIEVLYSEEEDTQDIYGNCHPLASLTFTFVESCIPMELPEINWQEQWQLHGYHYQDGFVHVDLQDFGSQTATKPIKLMPGAGFGDLSHPTTQLLLILMAKHLEGESVLDVGCGSGILAIAAISLGCPYAIALDIDVKALEHAHHNAVINGMENQIKFYTPKSWDTLDIPPTVLMNMISSEQVVAWNSLKPAQYQFKKVLTSGVSKHERESYLEMIKNWGLDCLVEIEQEGWLGFVLARTILR